jgi:hypothetical protein
MIKFFLFLALIFGFFVIGTGYVLRKVKNLFIPIGSVDRNTPQKQDADVLYSKDDVVVLKGDAKKHN